MNCYNLTKDKSIFLVSIIVLLFCFFNYLFKSAHLFFIIILDMSISLFSYLNVKPDLFDTAGDKKYLT